MIMSLNLGDTATIYQEITCPQINSIYTYDDDNIFFISNWKILRANVKLKVNEPQKRMRVMDQLIETKNSKIFHFEIFPIHS